MKLKLFLSAIIVFAWAFFPSVQAFSSEEGRLEIKKPVPMETNKKKEESLLQGDRKKNHHKKLPWSKKKKEKSLEINKPLPMEIVLTSNVEIEVRFNFSIADNQNPFRAWLNGKSVGSLFILSDDGLVATALLSAKDGVKASLNGPRMNVFYAEVEGSDGKKHHQAQKFLVDCSENQTPVADIELDEIHRRIFVNETVVLDGSGSFDADQDPLRYRWSFVTLPKKSKTKFSDPSSSKPVFVPDMPGIYVAKLIVNDYKAKSVPKTVKVKVERLNILIDRAVEGQIFEKISHHATVDIYDGSQVAADYHVVILDGNAHTAQELISNRLLRDALAEGKWGLVLNVKDDHKTVGVSSHLGIGTKGESNAYLFKRFLDGNTPVFRIFELPRHDILETEDPDFFSMQTGLLLREIRESWGITSLRAVQADPPQTPIPENLINCRWDYSYPNFYWMKDYSGRHSASAGRKQTGLYNINYTFTLFLDNANQPLGNRQYLLLQIDAESNPNIDGSSFIATQTDMDKHNEYAWFQDKLTMDIKPQDAFWQWVANSPTSPNYETTYSTSVSFGVGFSPDGPSQTFGVTAGTSYTLTDWGITGGSSSGINQSWTSHSTDPPEHDGDYFGYWDMYDWYYGCGKPKRPNDMSMGQTQLHTSTAWRTDNVKNQVATFISNPTINVVDNYCSKDLGTTCCTSKHTHTAKTLFTLSSPITWYLDLGAVIPIDIEAITFSQSPALVDKNLGGRIKGSIVLKDPAGIDTWITNIDSPEPYTIHAEPAVDRVTIQKGKRTATFDIEVNAEGVPAGDSFFAYIDAFYAKKYTEMLAMKAIDPNDPKSPSVSPQISSDYSKWGGTTGSTGNWVEGYLVRYAVSFVYHSGESALGPWTDWEGPGHEYANPLLVNIPRDTTNTATARKIYRQFFADYQKADPSQGITLIGTLNDNTTTTYLDNNP